MNKLEIIGVVMMTIGGMFWLSEKYFMMKELEYWYSWGSIILYFGLAVWAFGMMRKQAENKKEHD